MKEFLSQFTPIDLVFMGIMIVFIVAVLWAIRDSGHALDLSELEDDDE